MILVILVTCRMKLIHHFTLNSYTCILVIDSSRPMYISHANTSSGRAPTISNCLLLSSRRNLVFIFCQRCLFHSSCCSNITLVVSQTCFRLFSSCRHLQIQKSVNRNISYFLCVTTFFI